MLSTLFQSISSLSCVGSKWLPHYERLGCKQLLDLLFHYPVSIIDRTQMPPLYALRSGQVVTQIVTVHEHYPSKPYSKTPYKVICSNKTGTLEIIYFRSNSAYLRKCFPIGKEVLVSGKIEFGHNTISMPHPDIVTHPSKLPQIAAAEPVYPLTYGLSSRGVRMAVKEALALIPQIHEWLPAELIQKHQWPSWHEAISKMHTPANENDINQNQPARDRLAFDEIMAQQLALQIMRRRNMPSKIPLNFRGELAIQYHQSIPFCLTTSQQEVIAEITKEQQSSLRMTRMLQGDVGSGKTAVAITAMLNAVEAGKQAVLMAPTEILARQHYNTIQQYVTAVASAKLWSSETSSNHTAALKSIIDGTARLIVGTHAVFQERVEFQDLGLVVIDEQHRFGVEQRLALMQKSMEADLLMMSATPIPRTLNMILYGDLDVSILREKPSNRLPILTNVISADRISELMDKLSSVEGEKVYWICPLIDESDKVVLTNVIDRYSTLNKLMPDKVGLVHGQMKMSERDKVMQDFIAGKLRVLVATTVIEVGVDVPDATTMIIEHAERFGLAQLHQLRGRVGRGSAQSRCILVYKAPLSEVGKQRLQIMRHSNDGFYIAEQDLKLRGSGEILGRKQSGLPEFRNYDLALHNHILDIANSLAHRVLQEDPNLCGQYLRMRDLLTIYGYDSKLYNLS